MPHCVISHCADLSAEQTKALVSKAHQAMVESELFKEKAIKVRSLVFNQMLTGGSNQAHVHIEVKLLAGRTQLQKQHLATLLKKACQYNAVDISVEIVDLAKAYYN
ncbi:5-carboxymethyl-2-hydroxymuconate Delta-isomerase [Facilibium subflavum]|uniref:5-carboxymethyl-2-hydroxymuconate Delta-isomerase n=1 Tax=Facilibium subflavum TaxID=2219058 RepID=UPI000E6508E3|nr:hypothetical protein [Facilibium subflavum]